MSNSSSILAMNLLFFASRYRLLAGKELVCLASILLPLLCPSLSAQENYHKWFSKYREALPTSWNTAIHSRILLAEAKKPDTVISLLHFSHTPIGVASKELADKEEEFDPPIGITGIQHRPRFASRSISVFGSFTPLLEAGKPFPFAGKVAFSREVTTAEATNCRSRACGLLAPTWRFSRGFPSKQELNQLVNGTLPLPVKPDDLLILAVGPANAKSIEDFFLLGPIPKEDKDEFSAFLAASYADEKDKASVENNYYLSAATLLKDISADDAVETGFFLSHHEKLRSRLYHRIFSEARFSYFQIPQNSGIVTSFSVDFIDFFSALKGAEKLRAYEAFEKEMTGLNALPDSPQALARFFTAERERLKDDDPHTPALRSILEKLIAAWS